MCMHTHTCTHTHDHNHQLQQLTRWHSTTCISMVWYVVSQCGCASHCCNGIMCMCVCVCVRVCVWCSVCVYVFQCLFVWHMCLCVYACVTVSVSMCLYFKLCQVHRSGTDRWWGGGGIFNSYTVTASMISTSRWAAMWASHFNASLIVQGSHVSINHNFWRERWAKAGYLTCVLPLTSWALTTRPSQLTLCVHVCPDKLYRVSTSKHILLKISLVLVCRLLSLISFGCFLVVPFRLLSLVLFL